MNAKDVEVMRDAAKDVIMRSESPYDDVRGVYVARLLCLSTPENVLELCELALQPLLRAPQRVIPPSGAEEPATLDTVVKELRGLRADLQLQRRGATPYAFGPPRPPKGWQR